jgi:hypothetical protein
VLAVLVSIIVPELVCVVVDEHKPTQVPVAPAPPLAA